MNLDRWLGRWGVPLFGVLAVAELAARLTFRATQPVTGPRLHTVSIHVAGTPASVSADGAVVLIVLCLAGTVPLGFLRPAAAAVAVTTANLLSVGLFQVLTVAAVAAQVVAGYRLGRSGPGSVSGSVSGIGRVQGLAVGLALPFLVLALAGVPGGEARVLVVLLASLGPVAALAGVMRRREVMVRGAVEQDLAGDLFEHVARGERARIARELHDVVAHHISMVAVQAETARLATPGMPELGARRLSEIGDTARAGLTEMRRLLGVLRADAMAATAELAAPGPPAGAADRASAGVAAGAADRHPQPGLPQLHDLLDEARDASGAGTRLIISGPVVSLDPGVELAVYRIVQEALTNARRHAPGAAVDVELRYARDALRLRVRDNGPAAAPGGGGHGLLGMRERAQAAGGEFRAGAAAGGGFLVEATLPVSALSVPAGASE